MPTMNIIDKKTAIRPLQLRQMLAVSDTSIIVGTLLASILAYMQFEVITSTVVISWFSLVLLVAVSRAALAFSYKQSPEVGPSITQARLLKFRVGVLASGAVWDSAGFLMFPADDPLHQMFLIFMLAGVVSGSVFSYSSDLFSAIGYSTSVLVPFIIHQFVAEDGLSGAMGVAAMLYLGFVVVTVRYINQNTTENIMLRLEAAARKKAVKSSEERYRLLLAHSPVGIFHYDTNLVITYCNDRFAKMMHKSADQFIGLDMRLLKDTSVLPALVSTLEGENSHYEGQYHTTRDGDVWINMICAPSRDSAGNVEGGIAIVQNITGRKQAEIEIERTTLELSAKNLLLQAILDNAPLGIWMLGVD